jgi:hypothetical protein
MDLSVVQAYDQRKKDAYLFLKTLEKELNLRLLPPEQLRTDIRKLVAESKGNSNEHLRTPESAFLNKFVIPKLFELVAARDGMDDSKAKQALLSEYKRMREKYASSGASPIRTLKHPFKKVMGVKPLAIMQQWTSGRDNALTQSSPDICIREPFPFKILFEGKYFEKGGREKAVTELVTSIYQAFFYRGLSYVPSRKMGQPAWDYEFACMLAGDVSAEGSLYRAWNNIPSEVKRGFWEGANIYVMIVPERQ